MKIDLRLVLFVVLSLVSLWYLLSPLVFKTAGVVVVSMDEGSKCGGMNIGDLIVQARGTQILDKEDFDDIIALSREGERVTMKVNWGPGGCTAIGDGNVGLEVSDTPSKFLKFGLDISGGKRTWLSVTPSGQSLETLEGIGAMIEDRAVVIGLPQIRSGVEDGMLHVDSLDPNDVPLLLSRGVIEGSIEQQIKVVEGVGQIKIGPEYYDIELPEIELPEPEAEPEHTETNTTNSTIIETNETIAENETVTTPPKTVFGSVFVNGEEYEVGEIFIVENIRFKVLNATDSYVLLSGIIFGNDDVSKSELGNSYVKYESSALQYQFFVPVDISDEASERFSKIVSGMPSFFVGESSILEGALVFQVDGEEINRLTMPTSMVNQNIGSLNLIGFGSDMQEATMKKKIVEMALVGDMEYDVAVDSIVGYEATGGWMLYGVLGVVGGVLIILFSYPLVFFKDSSWYKMSAWSSVLFLLVVLNVFGLASLSQNFFSPGWILDGPSLFGVLILCVGLLVWFVSIPRFVFERKENRIVKHVDYMFLVLGFVVLMVGVAGVGLVIICGVVLKVFFVAPLYKKTLSRL